MLLLFSKGESMPFLHDHIKLPFIERNGGVYLYMPYLRRRLHNIGRVLGSDIKLGLYLTILLVTDVIEEFREALREDPAQAPTRSDTP